MVFLEKTNDKKESAVFSVILAAAGKSQRFIETKANKPAVKKIFASIRRKPVWLYSAEKFYRREDVVQLIIVVSPDDLAWFFRFYAEEINRMFLLVVAGGKERADSIRNALAVVRSDVDFIAVHDAARPCVSKLEIDAVFRQARIDGAAMLATPIVGTIKRVYDGQIVETVNRENLWEAQTPQVFRRDILLNAYEHQNTHPTDDAQLVENAGYAVSVVPADRSNIKITTQTDLTLAETILLHQNDSILN
ncbi:MAG: 2-C-methyl-D-erythritol 4-phosphate cytidylyltransferase [Planctomycetaceae bacterium]|jgi:2-C-methyl-D-erythritol 4-phosphate cytidylyltransferase|nr:2-C-methyl-D-erythritol 4-phosphate cytidylyltransferase [Planctomycetaceae bacterium]